MNTTVWSTLFSKLNDLFWVTQGALDEGMARARRAARPESPQEPDLVYFVMNRLVPSLESGINSALEPGQAASVAGIYCHQSPIVDFIPRSSSKGCELGDLLLVCHYRTDSGDELNALLLQAKVGGPPSESGPQWRLYNSWPPFYWRHSPHYVRTPRPAAPHLGAQHLIFGEHGTQECRVAVPSSAPTFAALEIALFLCFRSGRRTKGRLEARTGSGGGWSEVIWDLLEDTGARLMNRSRTRVTNQPRAEGTLLMARAGSGGLPELMLDAIPEEQRRRFLEEEPIEGGGSEGGEVHFSSDLDQPGGGVSTIIVEVDARTNQAPGRRVA